MEEARIIDSERSQQESSTGQQINKWLLTSLFDLVIQDLGTYFKAKVVPTSARSSWNWSTALDTINNKYLDLPSLRVYTPYTSWLNGEWQATATQVRGMLRYVSDSPIRGSKHRYRVRFKMDRLEKNLMWPVVCIRHVQIVSWWYRVRTKTYWCW